MKTGVENDILVHDEAAPDPAMAFRLARMMPPEFPVAMGVQKSGAATYDDAITQQVIDAKEAAPNKTIHDLLHSGDTWEVK